MTKKPREPRDPIDTTHPLYDPAEDPTHPFYEGNADAEQRPDRGRKKFNDLTVAAGLKMAHAIAVEHV